MSAPPSAQSKLALAFLNHQVESLEKSVESIQFSRDARLYSTNKIKSTARKTKRERIVVDSSTFIYALALVKRWIREDSYQIIVPLQVISTLDSLKKAPNPIRSLANEATKFLETQFSIARQIESEAIQSGLKKKSEWDTQIRLRSQLPEEEISILELQKKFQLPKDFIIPEPILVEGEEPIYPVLPTLQDIPKSIRSILQCSLYHSTIPTILYNDPEITIDSLPLREKVLLPTRQNGTESTLVPITFPILAAGNLTSFWGNYFTEIIISPIATCEIIAAKEWAKQQAQLQLLAKEEATLPPLKASSGSRRNSSNSRGGRTHEESRRGGGSGRGRGESRSGGNSNSTIELGTRESENSASGMRGRGRSGVLFIP